MTIPTHHAPSDRDESDLSFPTGLLTRKQFDDLLEFADKTDLDTLNGRLAVAQYIEKMFDAFQSTDDKGKCPICGDTNLLYYGMCAKCYKSLFMRHRLRTIRNARGYKFYGQMCVACHVRPVESMGMCHACIQLKSKHKLKTIQDVYEYRQKHVVGSKVLRKSTPADRETATQMFVTRNYDALLGLEKFQK
jgi:hypothetical protein